MSAFLGPIHTWLFRKIKFQDELTKWLLEQAIAGENNNNLTLLEASVDRRYGRLEEGELADIIDPSNIHGWLQERIQLVENRLAFIVVSILDDAPDRLADLEQAALEYGRKYGIKGQLNAREVYKYLEDLLLNGMPCDHVNRVEISEDQRVLWSQTLDIHEAYWSSIKGDVEVYNHIRENLIAGLVENSGVTFKALGNQSFELSV